MNFDPTLVRAVREQAVLIARQLSVSTSIPTFKEFRSLAKSIVRDWRDMNPKEFLEVYGEVPVPKPAYRTVALGL